MDRWGLAERADSPRLNVDVKGRWNVGAETLVAEQIAVEGRRSNLRGMLRVAGGSAPSMELRLEWLGREASDLLAWYRGSHRDDAAAATAGQECTGGMILRGVARGL